MAAFEDMYKIRVEIKKFASGGRTFLVVNTPRRYNIIRSSEVDTHELRLSTASPDLSLYNFTFGPRRWSWATLDEKQWPGEDGS